MIYIILVIIVIQTTHLDGFSLTPTTIYHHTLKKSNVRLYKQSKKNDVTSEDLETVKARLQQMSSSSIDMNERDELYQFYIRQPANVLKMKCEEWKLATKGRKPDLANRLTEYTMEQKYSTNTQNSQNSQDSQTTPSLEKRFQTPHHESKREKIKSFAGLSPLSPKSEKALSLAQIMDPTPIQRNAIPIIVSGENVILHAETGSGKTLAYLLPIIECIYSIPTTTTSTSIALILTPTRELASQVSGIVQVLAPDNCIVRFVSEPTDLSDDFGRGEMERGENDQLGGRKDSNKGYWNTKIVIGSAKSVMTSLYGNNKLPAPPTPKPAAKTFMKQVRWIVLDEVDRLLNIPKTRQDRKQFSSKRHEKPAAILTSSIARFTLSRAQIIACSATVGRPLRREIARVLGLPSQESPQVIRSLDNDSNNPLSQNENQHGRMITVPDTIENYVLPCDGTSSGSLLTTSSFIIKQLKPYSKKILLVLTNKCQLNIRDTIGAIRHFNAHSNPQSLLDALSLQQLEGDTGTGTDQLINAHRNITQSTGIGQSSDHSNSKGYLLVTNENSVRGLHLDKLDLVIVVGRPHGPDEYTHIAGRTGRAGQTGGKVINVVSYEQATALTSWEKMLSIEFIPIDMKDIEQELV